MTMGGSGSSKIRLLPTKSPWISCSGAIDGFGHAEVLAGDIALDLGEAAVTGLQCRRYEHDIVDAVDFALPVVE